MSTIPVQDTYTTTPIHTTSSINPPSSQQQPIISSHTPLSQQQPISPTTKDKLNNSMSQAGNAASNAANQASNAAANAAEQIKAHPAVQQAQQSFSQYMAQLDKELSRYPILNQLEERTQVPKSYGVLIASIVFLSTIFVNSLALPVSNLVGWALPAYLSHKAIETPAQDDDVQWLTYWTVFGFFTFLESLMLRPVLYYVPYYFPIKTAFVLWLQLPATRGAVTFHHSVMKPVVNNINARKPAGYSRTFPSNTNTYTSAYPTSSSEYTSQAPAHDKLM